MPRPKITKEMVLEAAKGIAENIGGDAETIARHYRHPMDGYELARELDPYEGLDLTMQDVMELDNLSGIVSDLHRKAEKKWVEENNIQPPLPIGTRITQGVIDSVFEYSAATYRVKENGCTQKGRFLLIRFEDAVAVEKFEEEATCAVDGMIRPGVMCGSVIVGGKLCGHNGQCEHRRTGDQSK